MDATSGNLTITLLTAVGRVRGVTVKKVDSSANTVTVDTTSSQTIDGALTAVLTSEGESIDVVSDNANWSII